MILNCRNHAAIATFYKQASHNVQLNNIATTILTAMARLHTTDLFAVGAHLTRHRGSVHARCIWRKYCLDTMMNNVLPKMNDKLWQSRDCNTNPMTKDYYVV